MGLRFAGEVLQLMLLSYCKHHMLVYMGRSKKKGNKSRRTGATIRRYAGVGEAVVWFGSGGCSERQGKAGGRSPACSEGPQIMIK